MAKQDSTETNEREAIVLDVLAAADTALDAALDLHQPRQTAARCLTVSATLSVAVDHPGRAEWAADRLRRLAQEWRTA
jgi:hypothetical protein